MSEWA
jgi:hypothetical protein